MTYPFSKLQEAVAFAARAHHGQLRKDRQTPYASHPFRVCLVLSQAFGVSEVEALTAAVLHDTIEDTTTDFDDLTARFGPRVAEWVRALTKDKRLPEAEREETYARALAAGGPTVHLLKLADVFDNLTDLDQLPAERRPHTLARARFYLERLRPVIDGDARPAFERVEELLERLSRPG
jgi:guanosine-3',5'-bis(diphosphate) 3'-pyrophosphohydrolase